MIDVPSIRDIREIRNIRNLGYKIAICVLSIVIIAVSVFAVISYKDMVSYRSRLALMNHEEWNNLKRTVNAVEGIKDDTQKIKELKDYENSNMYRAADMILPSFGKDKTNRFLATYYDALFAKIANDEVPKDKMEEAYGLLFDMNADLGKICDFVLYYPKKSSVDRDDIISRQKALVDKKSGLNKEVSAQIDAFCEKHAKAIDKFYEEIKK